MSADFKLTGVSHVAGAIRRIGRKFPDRVDKATKTEADNIMRRSKEEFVPVDAGELRDSGKVSEPERHGDVHSVTMAYGEGGAQEYAAAVHETPSGMDPPSWRGAEVSFNKAGTGAKYLERPLMEAANGMFGRVSEMLKSGVKEDAK